MFQPVSSIPAAAPLSCQGILWNATRPRCSLCTRFLERAGYRVRTETDPRIAFSTFRENPGAVDLILCDLTMPHLTGDRLVEMVHQVDPGLPIILMSGRPG